MPSRSNKGGDGDVHSAGSPDGQAAAAHPGEDVYVFPLTPQQRELWRIGQTIPSSSRYNGAFLFEITGPVRPNLVEEAVNALVRRHEILRSHVAIVAGEPKLVIEPDVVLKVSVSDLSLLTSETAEERIAELTRVEARLPFDLSRAPLLRVGLIRINEARSILMLTLHHLVCDGWSLGSLVNELVENYAGLASGTFRDTASPVLQFGDYATWLDEELTQPALTAQTNFWRKRFDGYQAFELPGDVASSPIDPDASDIIAYQLSTPEVERFQAAVAAEGGTLFTGVLAALTVVLGAAASRSEVSVGVPVVGRDQPELEPVIGPLINYLVMRMRLDPAESFASLERRIRDDAFEAFSNQSVPLETVVAALRAEGVAIPDPVYRVSFVSQLGYGNVNPIRPFADCHLRSLPSVSSGSIYDLFFFLVRRETGYRLSLEFRTGKYSLERANALLDSLARIIVAVGATSGVRVSELMPAHLTSNSPIAEPAVPVARTESDEGSPEPAECADGGAFVLPSSIAQQRYWLLAKADPSNTALHVTACVHVKGDLDVANLQRSLSAIAGRHEALGTVMRDIDGVLHQIVAPERHLPLVMVDFSELPFDAAKAEAIARARSDAEKPFDLELGPLVRSQLYKLDERNHVFMQSLHHIICDGQSIAIFQRELWQTYTALTSGSASQLPDVVLQFGDFAANEQASLANDALQPQIQFWQKILTSPLPILDFPLEQLPENRQAAPPLIERLSIDAETVERLKALARKEGTTMFAATAAAFATLLVRFGRGTDVLFGCPVANRTAETAGVIGPFAGPLPLRIDASGDPALYEMLLRMRDVCLDALSNADVPFDHILTHIDARSIRGRNPLFQFYFVYQRAFLEGQTIGGLEITPVPTLPIGTPFELQLVMIERPDGVTAQIDFNPELLSQAFVRSILAYFKLILEKMANDGAGTRLSSLPEPILGSATRRGAQPVVRAYVAPRTAAEIQLASIWETLLKRNNIGVCDDFFDLGGQSILAARMVLAIEKELKVKIKISAIAHARTIEQMAKIVEAPDSASSLIVPLRTASAGTPLFLVHCGGGHILRYGDLVNLLGDNQAVYGISAPELSLDDHQTSVESLAQLYLEELRRIQPIGPYQIGGYSFGGLVAYEMACQLTREGETVALLAILDTVNRQHYRKRSVVERGRMVSDYITDRGSRHLARLKAEGLDAFAREGIAAAGRRLRPLTIKLNRTRAGQPAALEHEITNLNLVIFEAMAKRYRPRPYAGRVLVIHAEGRGQEYRANPTLGWEELAAMGAEAAFVPGDHMSFMRPPYVARLAEQFLARLMQTTNETTPAARASKPK